MRRKLFPAGRAAALLLLLALAGCNAFGITGEEEGNEVRITVRALGADYFDADDSNRYLVDSKTEYEGLSGFTDVKVGVVVQVEFEETGTANTRRALEIEADGPEDGD